MTSACSLLRRLQDRRILAGARASIAAESRERRRSKSEVIRERLALAGRSRPGRPTPVIADLVGSVDHLPVDLSRRKKAYLKATGHGRKRPR